MNLQFFSFLLLQNIHIGVNTPVADGNNGDVFSDLVEILVLVFALIFGLEIAIKLL